MFGNTVQNDLALVEQIKMIVNYLRGLLSITIGVGTPGTDWEYRAVP